MQLFHVKHVLLWLCAKIVFLYSLSLNIEPQKDVLNVWEGNANGKRAAPKWMMQ